MMAAIVVGRAGSLGLKNECPFKGLRDTAPGQTNRNLGRGFMAFSRRTAVSVAFAAAAGLTLWGAAAPAGAETVLKRGMGPTIGTLDPQINFLANEAWVQDDMYEGLAAIDGKGEIIPGAADKWE